MRIRILCTVLCVALAALSPGEAARADALDLSLNDDAVRANYQWAHPTRDFQVDGGWLHHQDRGDVVHIGFHVTGDASSGDTPLDGGIGGKIFHVSPDNGPLDATVLAVGGFFRYTFPRYNRFNLYGHAYIAPDVLSFGDGEQFQEIELRAGYSVLRNADVFIGARYTNTEFDPAGDLTSDNGLHLGIQLKF
ncbi:MAG: YfaZ family outer membrane protein [Pseudomonadota bacterium]